MSVLQQNIDFLNLKFLKIRTDQNVEDRKHSIDEEITLNRQRIKELMAEYYKLVNNSYKILDIGTLSKIMDSVPVLHNAYEPITSLEKGGGIFINIMHTHNNLTLGGDTLLYQTLPIYGFKILIPQAGELQITNCSELIVEPLNKRDTFGGDVDYSFVAAYSHPHSSSRTRTFSRLCAGNNPFLSMYQEGEIRDLKEFTIFIVNSVRWVQTTNMDDLYSGAPLYKMVGLNSPLSVTDRMLHNVILPTLKEVVNQGHQGIQYFVNNINSRLEGDTEDTLYKKVLLGAIETLVSRLPESEESKTENIYVLEKFLYGSYLISHEFQRKTEILSMKDGNILNSIYWDMLLIASGNMDALLSSLSPKHKTQLITESRAVYNSLAELTGTTILKEGVEDVRI